MTGQQLYRQYQRAASFYDCVVDEWEDLDEQERNIWIKLALEILS